MSLTKDAIQLLQSSAQVKDINDLLQHEETVAPVLATTNDVSLSSLEEFMPNRSRMRMSFSTSLIEEFVQYSEEYDQEGAKCFVDPDEMSALVIFDIGTEYAPLHQKNKAYVNLKQTAAMKGMLSTCDYKLSQKQAAEFIEDWADYLKVITKCGEAMTPYQAAAALRDLTLEKVAEANSKVDDFSESMSAMERIEAKAKDKLPSMINFTCVPYMGLEERTFKISLSIIADEKPKISLRIIRFESENEEMAEEFKQILTEKFAEFKAKIFIGSV